MDGLVLCRECKCILFITMVIIEADVCRANTHDLIKGRSVLECLNFFICVKYLIEQLYNDMFNEPKHRATEKQHVGRKKKKRKNKWECSGIDGDMITEDLGISWDALVSAISLWSRRGLIWNMDESQSQHFSSLLTWKRAQISWLFSKKKKKT